MAAVFKGLGYVDSKKAKLRLPYHFAPPKNIAQRCQSQTQYSSKAAVHERFRGTKMTTSHANQSHFPQCFALLFAVRSGEQDARVILFQWSKILSCMRDIISVRDHRGGGVASPVNTMISLSTMLGTLHSNPSPKHRAVPFYPYKIRRGWGVGHVLL